MVLQSLAIGLCILGNESSEEVYPRWLGYASLWVAFLSMPGALIPFFKTGPFAWNGLFGFWLAVIAFFFWFSSMYVYTVKAIRGQQAREKGTVWDSIGIKGNVERKGATA